MKKYVCVAAGVLVAFASSAQVKITSVTPEGGLAWTNLAADGLTVSPVYRVDSSSSPTGDWQTVTNTTQTSITNFPAFSPGAVFYRVAWTNGQVWSYAGYSGQSLIATGTLYLGVSGQSRCLIDGGAYYLEPGFPYRTGSGLLQELGCSNVPDFHDVIELSPYAFDDVFELDVLNVTDGAWGGEWHWEGFAYSVSGPFEAWRVSGSQ